MRGRKRGGRLLHQTIYVDILLAVNIFINYFLLLAAAKFLGVPIKAWRLAAGAVLGAVYSLEIFLPSVPVAWNLIIKIGMSATIVLAAFPVKSWKMFLKSMACFYAMNFAFGGFMLAIWYFAGPSGLIIKNSVVYLSISPVVLIMTTVVCYVILRVIFRFTGKQEVKTTLCTLAITQNNRTVSCTAKIDTGNSLVEPFSHYPVVVVEYDTVESILPESLRDLILAPQTGGNLSLEPTSGLRMVPFHSVAGEGVLPAFQPEGCVIDVGKKKICPHQIYVAVCHKKIGNGEFSALIHPELLSQESGSCKKKSSP